MTPALINNHTAQLSNLDDRGATKGPDLILTCKAFHQLHVICFSLAGHGFFVSFFINLYSLSSVPAPRRWEEGGHFSTSS